MILVSTEDQACQKFSRSRQKQVEKYLSNIFQPEAVYRFLAEKVDTLYNTFKHFQY